MGDMRNYAILAAMFFAALCVTCAAAELKSLRPVLFMDPEADALDRWGLLIPRPHAVQRSGPQFACPPVCFQHRTMPCGYPAPSRTYYHTQHHT